MSTFPSSSKLMKDAIVRLDEFDPLASAILFRYNLGSHTPQVIYGGWNP